MKRIINRKNDKNKKLLIKFFVVFVLLFFVCSSLILSKRKYLYTESGFKTFSSIINSYFIKKTYSNNKLQNDVINFKYAYLQEENNNLRKMLELKEKNENFIAAEVTNQISNQWFNKIVINKGYDDGIKKDLPVINSNGVIGFVTKTAKNISEVSLLTNVSEDNMISVIIESAEENCSGVLSSYDSNRDLFKITDVMTKTKINEGDNVILSGYNNNLYRGLYVGEVVKVETSDYGLTKNVWIRSKTNFNDVLFVAVLKEEAK